MNNQIQLVFALLILGLIAGYAQTATGPTSVPPAAYEHFFRHMAHLKAKDAESAAKSNSTSSNFSSYYKKLANLSQPQADALQSISDTAPKEVAALDLQAQALIAKTYAQRIPGQALPSPPAQLKTMQAQRIAILVAYRTQLQTALGATGFANLEQVLLANLRSTTKAKAGH